MYVFFGHHYTPDYINIILNNEPNVMKTTTFIVHENFDDSRFANDIALVFLPKQVTLTEHIAILPLDGGTDMHAGVTATVSGWGITRYGQSFQSGLGLRYAVDQVLLNAVCKASSSQLNSIIKDSHICLSNVHQKGTCSGDSGGPLVIDGVQVGIVSFGPSTCTPVSPSGFTRVSYFSEWIAQHSSGVTWTTSPRPELTTKASSSEAITFNLISVSLILIVHYILYL